MFYMQRRWYQMHSTTRDMKTWVENRLGIFNSRCKNFLNKNACVRGQMEITYKKIDHVGFQYKMVNGKDKKISFCQKIYANETAETFI